MKQPTRCIRCNEDIVYPVKDGEVIFTRICEECHKRYFLFPGEVENTVSIPTGIVKVPTPPEEEEYRE